MPVHSAAPRGFAAWGPALAVCLLALPAAGQPDTAAAPVSPAAADTSGATLLSTNPTGCLIEARRDQSAEQQLADQLDCYRWTCEQTDWDPYVAYDALVARGCTVPMTDQQLEAILLDAAARGAVSGAVAGSVAGVRGRGARLGAAVAIALVMVDVGCFDTPDDPAVRRAVTRFESDLGKWNAKFSGCMVRKGYKVSAP